MNARSTPQLLIRIALVAIAANICMTVAFASPSGDLKSALRKASGDDFRDYSWLSLPVDNFGVCTMFRLASLSDKPSDRNQICATWSCLGKAKPHDIRDEITVYSFVDEGNGRPLQIEERKARKIGLALVLKPLLASLGIDATLADSKTITTRFKTDRAYRRGVTIDSLKTHLDGMDKSSEAYAAYDAGLLAFIKADIVLSDIEVSVTLDKAKDGAIDAALARAAERASTAGESLGITVSDSTDGHYVLRNPGAAIYGVLAVKQPRGPKTLLTPNRDLATYVPVAYRGKE